VVGISEESMSTEKISRGLFRGITKNVFALGVVSALTDMSTEMIYPLLPIFLTSVLGVGTAFVGMIEGIAESTASVLKLFSGWLSDRLGKRKALAVAGYTISSLTRPLVAISTAGWHVLVARFIDRTGKGIRTSPRDALIADCTPEEHRGRAFGFHRAMDHFGAVIGPLLAFAVLRILLVRGSGFAASGAEPAPEQYRLLFWLAAIPAALTIIVLLGFVSECAPSGPRTQGPPKLSLKGFDRRFKTFLVIVLVFTLGNSSDAFLLLRARDLGVSVPMIPILWILLHIVKSLSSMPGGILSDRLGRRTMILIGWGVYAAVYCGLGAATSVAHIWVLFAAYGLYFGATEGVEKALVADFVPSEARGTAYGVYNFAIGITALPASVLMGVLWQAAGPGAAFGLGAGLALLAAISLWRLVR